MPIRLLILAMLPAALIPTASAHMVFILAQADGEGVDVVFSDALRIDERASSDRLTSLQLVAIDGEGKSRPLEWTREKHHLTAPLPSPRPVIVAGDVVYGYARSRHTGDRPVLIKQYPRAVIGSIKTVAAPRPGDRARHRIEAESHEGVLRLRVVREDGTPEAGAVYAAMVEGDEASRRRGTTDEHGYIPHVPQTGGRIGVWAKIVEAVPGRWEGKDYDEVHHYATLVYDLPRTGSTSSAP